MSHFCLGEEELNVQVFKVLPHVETIKVANGKKMAQLLAEEMANKICRS